ncbi:MAG: hypothetical protein ABIF08_03550 [Nanoarchaeota archaeon]
MKGGLRSGILISTIFVIIIVSGCVTFNQVDFKACTLDSDCISVPDGCCTCSSGGKATSINKNYEKEHIDSRYVDCLGTMCPMIISDDPTCFATPKCVENECTV